MPAPYTQQTTNSSSPISKSSLTEEQKEIIETNRLKALARRQAISETPEKSETTISQPCLECFTAAPDRVYVDTFGEYVCNPCKRALREYDLISKSDVCSNFLVTESTVRLMPFILKDNPKNPHWTQMKLYLRKHAMMKAIERWGSEDALEAEKTRRMKEQYERDLEQVTHRALREKIQNEVHEEGDSTLQSLLSKMIEDSGLSASSHLDQTTTTSRVSSSNSSHLSVQQAKLEPQPETKRKREKKISEAELKRKAKISRMAAIITGGSV